MHSRKRQMAISCSLFVLLAIGYQAFSGNAIDELRVLLWSAAGTSLYIYFSYFFGFDPHRTKLPASASSLLQYAERYELRSGIATLSMTLAVVLLAKIFDSTYFVTAVVSATLAAWLYFMVRIFSGGYEPVNR